jgi:hypothetical protein
MPSLSVYGSPLSVFSDQESIRKNDGKIKTDGFRYGSGVGNGNPALCNMHRGIRTGNSRQRSDHFSGQKSPDPFRGLEFYASERWGRKFSCRFLHEWLFKNDRSIDEQEE